MRRASFIQVCLATMLLLVPLLGMLGYAGARVLDLRHALAAARHAGAALDGALGACRARDAAEQPPPADARHVVGLTLG